MIVLGILLMVFQGGVIKIAMIILGSICIAFGLMDFFNRAWVLAIVKGVIGGVVILFGIFALTAVLYLLAGCMLVLGVLLLYERIKARGYCVSLFQKIIAYTLPCVCLLVGVFLLFSGSKENAWVLVVNGVLVFIGGGLLFVDGIVND